MEENLKELIITWHDKVRIAAKAHCQSSVQAERNNFRLGLPVVIFTTIVGTGIIATVGNTSNNLFQISIGLISLFAAILASLQTFLQFSQKSAKHKESSTRFESLQKELEQLLVYPPDNKEETIKILNDFRSKYESLNLTAPNIPEKIWNSAREFVKESKNNSLICPE